MAEVIDFEHTKRARRLVQIFIAREGVASFLFADAARPFPPRIDDARVEDAVDTAMAWIARRTGREPTGDTRARMSAQFRRELVARVAESMVRAGL